MTDDRSTFTEAREDLKTPAEWCRIEGVEILDPDGWRGRDGRPWTDPITLAEFQERLVTCTMRHVVKGGDGREPLRSVHEGATMTETPEIPDGYALVERFWKTAWPTLADCEDECGTCKPCVTHWALTWSLAALSNPALVDTAEQHGAWKWTTEPLAPCPHAWEEMNPGHWVCKECLTGVDLTRSPDWSPPSHEPTFTASEVKELTTKATEVALALGRMEALTEIADEMAVEQDDERISYVTLQTDRETWGILLAAKTPSQPHQTVSNGPTAPAGQLDLPPTPETPQEGA